MMTISWLLAHHVCIKKIRIRDFTLTTGHQEPGEPDPCLERCQETFPTHIQLPLHTAGQRFDQSERRKRVEGGVCYGEQWKSLMERVNGSRSTVDTQRGFKQQQPSLLCAHHIHGPHSKTEQGVLTDSPVATVHRHNRGVFGLTEQMSHLLSHIHRRPLSSTNKRLLSKHVTPSSVEINERAAGAQKHTGGE